MGSQLVDTTHLDHLSVLYFPLKHSENDIKTLSAVVVLILAFKNKVGQYFLSVCNFNDIQGMTMVGKIHLLIRRSGSTWQRYLYSIGLANIYSSEV